MNIKKNKKYYFNIYLKKKYILKNNLYSNTKHA